MARLKSKQALSALVRLRKDPDEAVRSAVERALDSIVTPKPGSEK